MGVKFGYETDKYGRPMEVIVDYFDDGLDVICDMNNLTDYVDTENVASVPSYMHMELLNDLSDDDEDKKIEADDDIDPYQESIKRWKMAQLIHAIAYDEDHNPYW